MSPPPRRSHVQVLAQIIARLASERGSRIVPRTDIRRLWHDEFPEHDRQVPVTNGAKVRRRRKTYLAGSAHRAGRSYGTQGRAKIQSALKTLEGWALIERPDGEHVRIIDVPRLVRLARGERDSSIGAP